MHTLEQMQLTLSVPPPTNTNNTQLVTQLETIFRRNLTEFGSTLLSQIRKSQDQQIITPKFPPIFVSPKLKDILPNLLPLNADPVFRSTAQAELVQACSGKEHILGILATGGGKSLSFFACHLLVAGKLCIVIYPLVALGDDLMMRSSIIPSLKWASWTDEQADKNDPQLDLLFVSADQAARSPFRHFCQIFKDRIHRIFIEEAHHLLIDPIFRPCFDLLRLLTSFGIPFTFLTATIYPESIPTLCEQMLIPQESLRQIRQETYRPNIRYTMKQYDLDDLLSTVVAHIRECMSQTAAHERGIIYCTSTRIVKDLGQALGIPTYTATISLDLQENKKLKFERLQNWKQGKAPWIVGTQCLGEGVDFPSVRWVFVFDPNSHMLWVQMIGRAGRDGKEADAFTYWSRLPPLEFLKDGDHEGLMRMRHTCTSILCLRLHVGEFDLTQHSCASIANALFCSNCEKMLGVSLIHLHYCLFTIEQDALPDMQPMSVNVPMTSTPEASGFTIGYMQTPQTNAQPLDTAKTRAFEQFVRVQTLLDAVASCGCAFCYVNNTLCSDKHDLTQHESVTLGQSLFFFFKNANIYHAWCYNCWIPFDAPFKHPPHPEKEQLKPESCPYYEDLRPNGSKRGILREIAMAIYVNKAVQGKVFEHLKISCKSCNDFKLWIQEVSPEPYAIPNYIQFVLAYCDVRDAM